MHCFSVCEGLSLDWGACTWQSCYSTQGSATRAHLQRQIRPIQSISYFLPAFLLDFIYSFLWSDVYILHMSPAEVCAWDCCCSVALLWWVLSLWIRLICVQHHELHVSLSWISLIAWIWTDLYGTAVASSHLLGSFKSESQHSSMSSTCWQQQGETPLYQEETWRI